MAALVGVALAVVLVGCVSGSDDPVADATADADGRNGTDTSPPPQLELVAHSADLYCDDTDQLVGEIRGAEPGEPIVLSSPQPIQLSDQQANAVADEAGTYRLTWRCGATDAGRPFEVVVQGGESGRWVTVSFTGSSDDPDAEESLRVELFDDAFACDGRSRDLGVLSNAQPFETVTFTSDRGGAVLDGEADGEGQLMLRWQCSPDEVATWQVTATGTESNRVGEFAIVGVEPPPEEVPTPIVQIDEDPFRCDDGTRVFGTLSGFLPGEFVDFDSPQASTMLEGQADGDGSLPIRWTCGAADAGTVWEVTATGVQSGRTVTFSVTGAEAPPAPDPVVEVSENPFGCDDTTRFFATITGFVPREFVDFTSPQVENLRQGQADETGALQLRWTCGAGDVDRVWDVTATGATSGRSVTFQITGAPPSAP